MDDRRALILEQVSLTLDETKLTGLGDLERGKVRDLYFRDDEIVLVATDRLSAFDVVLTTIPFKGEVLTRMAVYWFEQTRDILHNHIIAVPDPSVMVVHRCEPVPVEIIVRGYITGSLWRDYQSGEAGAYGVELPGSLKRDQRFSEPIITPTTKARRGEHDLPISREEIIESGLVEEGLYSRCEQAARALFDRGVTLAAQRGLILVDTKYEFGVHDGKLLLMDEVHTSDSSRYWVADTYQARFASGEPQQMLDKENIRQWLIKERGYQGDGPLPDIPDEVRASLAEKYIDAYERITHETFEFRVGSVADRIRNNLASYLR